MDYLKSGWKSVVGTSQVANPPSVAETVSINDNIFLFIFSLFIFFTFEFLG